MTPSPSDSGEGVLSISLMVRAFQCQTRLTTSTSFRNPFSQQEGIGFPEARLVALSCAATGAIIDAVITPAMGKATGELSQMRTLARSLTPGDILVGDAIYDTYWTFVMLQGISCDGVFEINGSRSRAGKRRKHLILERPRRPEWMDAEAYELCPKQIKIRLVISRRRGYLDTVFVTTLTDESLISAKEIIALYANGASQRNCVPGAIPPVLARCQSLTMATLFRNHLCCGLGP